MLRYLIINTYHSLYYNRLYNRCVQEMADFNQIYFNYNSVNQKY
jgi:hypothetical protein